MVLVLPAFCARESNLSCAHSLRSPQAEALFLAFRSGKGRREEGADHEAWSVWPRCRIQG
jgi:hypothetical protein